MEEKEKNLFYSSEFSFFSNKSFIKILEDIENFTHTNLELHIKVKCNKRRENSFEKIKGLTNTIEYYKIDSSKELMYIKFNGNKRQVKKDIWGLKLVLIQSN